MNIQKIVLASNNIHKIKEFQYIFTPLNIEIIPQSKLNIPEVEEPYATFVENALHKARHCSKYSGMASLSDDSGLCVAALQGLPGVNSALYAGLPKNDLKNNEKLLYTLKNVANRRAYFYCTLVLVQSFTDATPLIVDGKLHGQIATQIDGQNGFGYDPIFYLPQYKQTLAELSIETKNQISHRKLAINNLLQKYDTI